MVQKAINITVSFISLGATVAAGMVAKKVSKVFVEPAVRESVTTTFKTIIKVTRQVKDIIKK